MDTIVTPKDLGSPIGTVKSRLFRARAMLEGLRKASGILAGQS